MVLDTHVLIWLDQGHDALGQESTERTQAAFQRDELFVAAITFWEVAMLERKRRIRMRLRPAVWRKELLDAGLNEIAIDGHIGIVASDIEGLNGDPADRLILAAAQSAGAELVTADQRLLDWRGHLERFDARR